MKSATCEATTIVRHVALAAACHLPGQGRTQLADGIADRIVEHTPLAQQPLMKRILLQLSDESMGKVVTAMARVVARGRRATPEVKKELRKQGMEYIARRILRWYDEVLESRKRAPPRRHSTGECKAKSNINTRPVHSGWFSCQDVRTTFGSGLGTSVGGSRGPNYSSPHDLELKPEPLNLRDAVAAAWRQLTPDHLKDLQELNQPKDLSFDAGALQAAADEEGIDRSDFLQVKPLLNNGSICYANALVQVLKSVILGCDTSVTEPEVRVEPDATESVQDAKVQDAKLRDTILGNCLVSTLLEQLGFALGTQRDPVDVLRAIESLPLMKSMMWTAQCDTCGSELKQMKLEETKPIVPLSDAPAASPSGKITFAACPCPTDSGHRITNWLIPDVVFQCIEKHQTMITPEVLASLDLDDETVKSFLAETPFNCVAKDKLELKPDVVANENKKFIWQGKELHEEAAKSISIDIFGEDSNGKRLFDQGQTDQVIAAMNKRPGQIYHHTEDGGLILAEKVWVGETEFRLRGAIVHVGNNNSGHYYALRKYANKIVVLNDDHAPTERPTFTLLRTESPRILVYQRC